MFYPVPKAFGTTLGVPVQKTDTKGILRPGILRPVPKAVYQRHSPTGAKDSFSSSGTSLLVRTSFVIIGCVREEKCACLLLISSQSSASSACLLASSHVRHALSTCKCKRNHKKAYKNQQRLNYVEHYLSAGLP